MSKKKTEYIKNTEISEKYGTHPKVNLKKVVFS